VIPPPPLGPGDDASVLGSLLLTTDALLEGEHFRAGEPSFLIGRKAIAVNVSDIAAMGGTPRAFLRCLGLPPGIPRRTLGDLVDGIASAAEQYGLAWIGGDTVRSRRGIAITVTVIGETGRNVLTRSGARPGDGIFVTGPLGASAAGRALLESGWRAAPDGSARSPKGPASAATRLRNGELLRAQLDPAPRVAAGRFLSDLAIASAAIDLSDGLSLDLRRLCDASGAGAIVHEEAVPISQGTRFWAQRARRNPLRLALDGGEDYEILFTVPRRKEPLLASWPTGEGTGPILIGRIRLRKEGIRLAGARGRTTTLRAGGYDPFLRTRVVDSP
jgi:thiamine-monophosphate kinase